MVYCLLGIWYLREEAVLDMGAALLSLRSRFCCVGRVRFDCEKHVAFLVSLFQDG
ncbi:hypothetical protein SAMN06264849_101510 [Melghirimyces algeriensis]|uniref:Uncharacterized protein n=1 Tax=Melghirimyces algeriensis TaxID=910412 RepID=A0A521B2P4_9BACL|nr:hypothetical protein SAMN06264849_101510 [Melghirimyces algeriensis]